MFTALEAAGAIAEWLHIAGPITSILPSLPESGATIINFDYCVKPCDVITSLPATCCNGNIKPFDFEEAGPERITDDSNKLMDSFAQRGGFILSSGCEIPPGAKPENIQALVSAAHARR